MGPEAAEKLGRRPARKGEEVNMPETKAQTRSGALQQAGGTARPGVG